MGEAGRDFARLGLRDDGREKFQRDASAGKRDAMRSGRVIGRRDFVQPRAGGTRGQFVGAGEGNQFKVFHIPPIETAGKDKDELKFGEYQLTFDFADTIPFSTSCSIKKRFSGILGRP